MQHLSQLFVVYHHTRNVELKVEMVTLLSAGSKRTEPWCTPFISNTWNVKLKCQHRCLCEETIVFTHVERKVEMATSFLGEQTKLMMKDIICCLRMHSFLQYVFHTASTIWRGKGSSLDIPFLSEAKRREKMII